MTLLVEYRYYGIIAILHQIGIIVQRILTHGNLYSGAPG